MVVQRVQALAEAGLTYLPSEYIQPPELRSDRHCHIAAAASAESGSIPVLDLDPSMSPLSHIRLLCSEWGAFQVVNHGVPSRLLEEMKEVGLRFFRSPTEAKLRYACDPGSAATEGYGSRMLSKEEGVLDWRDYFDHHTLPDSRRNPSRWPDFPDNYRDVVVEYSDSMKVLAQKLLSMISESLNLPFSYIEDAIGEVHQNITISYYSPCPQPELALGLQSHSDMGAITLLIQDDVGGLEVFKDGKWVLAKPLSDAIVVILADQTEHGAKDGSSLDTMSCVSYGDATSSIRGSEVDQEPFMAEQIMYYPVNGFYGYYYPGYDGAMGDWDDDGYFVGPDGLEIQHSATQWENEPLLYYFPGFNAGYSPYASASLVVGGDGQYFTQHFYQPSPILHHQPLMSSGFVAQSVAYAPELAPAYAWDSSPILTGGYHDNGCVRDPTPPYPKPSHPSQNHAIIPSRASAPPVSAALAKQGVATALDLSQNSAMQNQTLKPMSKGNSEVSQGFIQASKFNSYPSPGKSGLLVPSMAGNGKTAGEAWIGAEKQMTTNEALVAGDFDVLNEQSRGARTIGSHGAWVSGYDSTAGSEAANNTLPASMKKEDYNLPNFPTSYEHAFFFVIKSYSEDDIHKSIKYNVWASTPNGNKRLDNAYQVAQQKAEEKGCKCPVFLYFSVNASGQFCGVAEMIGQVDFNKTMNFWQQDKWTGYFPVKWHIIKDIPNPQFRHIILENNDNKPVTNSRDTQEVKFHQGTVMLNVFKNYSAKTSILDDFDFYESRQKALQDKRSKLAITMMPKAEAIALVTKPADAKFPEE